MTRNDIINMKLINSINWMDKSAAEEFFYNKLEELKAEGYSNPRWTLAEYALRCTECACSSIVEISEEITITRFDPA